MVDVQHRPPAAPSNSHGTALHPSAWFTSSAVIANVAANSGSLSFQGFGPLSCEKSMSCAVRAPSPSRFFLLPLRGAAFLSLNNSGSSRVATCAAAHGAPFCLRTRGPIPARTSCPIFVSAARALSRCFCPGLPVDTEKLGGARFADVQSALDVDARLGKHRNFPFLSATSACWIHHGSRTNHRMLRSGRNNSARDEFAST